VDGVALAAEPPTTSLSVSDRGPPTLSFEGTLRVADVDGSLHPHSAVRSLTRKGDVMRCSMDGYTHFVILSAGDHKTTS
jgi:hypothetical protein